MQSWPCSGEVPFVRMRPRVRRAFVGELSMPGYGVAARALREGVAGTRRGAVRGLRSDWRGGPGCPPAILAGDDGVPALEIPSAL